MYQIIFRRYAYSLYVVHHKGVVPEININILCIILGSQFKTFKKTFYFYQLKVG